MGLSCNTTIYGLALFQTLASLSWVLLGREKKKVIICCCPDRNFHYHAKKPNYQARLQFAFLVLTFHLFLRGKLSGILVSCQWLDLTVFEGAAAMPLEGTRSFQHLVSLASTPGCPLSRAICPSLGQLESLPYLLCFPSDICSHPLLGPKLSCLQTSQRRWN